MTIEEHYRTVRAAARKLGRRDSLYVIWAYCQYLQANEFEIPADIQVANQFLKARPPQAILAEWTLEQIAREVIRHADEGAVAAYASGTRSLRLPTRYATWRKRFTLNWLAHRTFTSK
jgi:hypothetical protein